MANIRVFGTGFDSNGNQLSAGQDCNWSLTGGGVDGVVSPWLVASNYLNGAWVQPEEGGAQFSWIWMNVEGTGVTPDGSPCVFRQTFDLSNCDLNGVVLSINLAGDDSATIRLNGEALLDHAGWGALTSRTVNGPANFIQGLNSLSIEVPNHSGQGGLACAISCTAGPVPPGAPTNNGTTYTLPVIIPPATQGYQLPAVSIPKFSTISTPSPTLNYAPNSFASAPAAVSATIVPDPNNSDQSLLIVSLQALDQPLQYKTSTEVVPANASVTVTISTGGK